MWLTPDEVKALLKAGAHPFGAEPAAQGHGSVDVAASDGSAVPADARQTFPRAQDRPQGHRRRARVFEDWLGRRWSGRRWSAELWTGRRWSGVKWTGVKW